MVPAEEENFPRGGRKVNPSLKRPKPDDSLFSTEKSAKPKKSKKRKSQKGNVTEETFHSTLNIQGTLSYSKIQDGMIILGCVRHITNFSLEVELPGLTFGMVSITNISDPFTKHLSTKLEENDEGDVTLKNMFKIGQFVLTKVLSVEEREKGAHIECTINPRDINQEKSHNSFKKGMLIWASVQSVLDHGYQLNAGVKNCRVFLPAKNVDEGRVFTIGEPLWCTIHKSESTSSVTTLRVSSKDQHIKTTKIEEISGLHDVIPGMQVELVTEKITSSGIQGKYLNDYFGYVDETQLKYPLKKLEDYKEGKLITAFVLYIEQATKITHLTLRNLDPVPPPSHTIGDIVSAEIISRVHKGIYLKLSTNEKCFVTNKRLLKSLPTTANLEVSEAIKTKFPSGSKHVCRILDYNYMMRVYVATVEQSLVKEKVFNSEDVKIGQLLNVTVHSVKPEGLIVTSGHVRGFVPNMHISNVNYSENLKKKFKEGYKAKARVLNVDDGNIIFTLKPSLVESDRCLTELEQATRGEQYTGVVVYTNSSGACINFYGNVKGWISKGYIDGDKDSKPDPTEYFYKGQVVKPWVFGIKDGKVILTLKPLSELKKQHVKIGQRMTGIVSKIHKDKIDIKSPKGGIIGTIPVNHLSCTQSLCSVLLKTYKTGDEIKDLLCIDNKEYPVLLSRREALALDRCRAIELNRFKNLKRGNLVRCSYMSDCESGIYVLPLILDHTENILIKNEDIVSEGETLPKFNYLQSLVGKILNINHKTKEIQLTAKFSEVYDNNVETSIGLFSQHLADIKYIKKFGYENDWDLCQYQAGERVTCIIEQLGDEGGCLVTLPNGIKGLVPPHLCPKNVKPGQTMEGVFISEDFNDNYAEICLKNDISQKINKVQDAIIDSSSLTSCITEYVIFKNESIIGVLKQNGNRQFVHIPLYLHENDNNGCRSYYEKNKFKLCICGKVGNYLIGMSKHLFITLEKRNKQNRKHEIIENKINSNKKNQNLLKSNEPHKVATIESVTSNSFSSIIIKDEETADIEDIESDNDSVTSEEEEDKTEEADEIDKDDYNVQQSRLMDTGGTKRKREKETVSKNIKFGNETIKNFATSDSITGPLPVLSGVSSFFNQKIKVENESSSDEEEEEVAIKKKRKLTPAERAELARKEEERISRIENELANSTKAPESAEQFDRLLLSKPDSSEWWTRYMSFHIAATEFDKARSVAKRALESINMTLIDERLNIWVALLNLENMLGTKESFEKTFEEAVKCNDSLQIYLTVIKMLAEAGKLSDMEEKIKKVRNKHKQEPTMWLEVAKVYYLLKKYKEARNIKDASLKSIQDKQTQMNLIIRFAIMEFKYGEEEQGAAIFETILSSDPRKVHVWTVYVDQLVKRDRIEQARKVLERSVCQRLPLKSMKTLFLKFRMFEEKHGTPDSVEAVKLAAKEFVTKAGEK